MFSFRALVVVSALVGALQVPVFAAKSSGVELIQDSEWLQPGTTLEFRFDSPMVAGDALGPVVGSGPLVIEPEMAGNFTWLSTRSGVFVPTGPLPLGTNYVVRLRPDLKTAAGKAVKAGFEQEVKTPAFRMTQFSFNRGSGEMVPPQVQVRAAFNLPVTLPGDADAFAFVNDKGTSIPADVRFATTRDYFPLAAADDDWNERWLLSSGQAAPPNAMVGEEEGESPPERDQVNRLILTPTTPLTTGSNWKLVAKSGVKAADGSAQTQPIAIELGEVQPMTLRNLNVANYLNGGRSVSLQFSDRLAQDLTEAQAAELFRISPEVPNLKFETSWVGLEVVGDFALDQEYTLSISPEVISAEGLPIEGELRHTFSFEPVAPRVFLPEITGQQFAGGRRTFEVLSVNLKALKVRAVLVEPHLAARALAAFAEYPVQQWNPDAPDEVFQPLAPEAITGRVLSEQVVELASAVDSRQETTLDWNTILGDAPQTGVIFLTVEGEPREGLGPEHPAGQGLGPKRPAAQALMQLTDLGILWKKPDGDLRVMTFSMATGRPVAGAKVSLLDAEFAALGQGASDAAGAVALAVPSTPSWLVVETEGDVHVVKVGPGATELPMAAFRLPVYYRDWDTSAGNSPTLRGFLFTDRPLYQPGEKVQVKGMLRKVTDGGLQAAAGVGGVVNLLNPQWEKVAGVDFVADEAGNFDLSLELPSAPLGGYRLMLETKDGVFPWWSNAPNASFLVANYQPDAFQVSLDLSVPSPDSSKSLEAAVTAAYFFGGRVGAAEIRWTLRYGPTYFAPSGFERFYFIGARADRPGTLTLRGEAEIEGSEPVMLRPELPAPQGLPYSGQLTVEVTDLNQQTVSQTAEFRREASAFYLGVATPEYNVTAAGDSIRFPVVAVTPEGQPMPQPVDYQAALIRQRYETVRVKGAGNAISFRSEVVEERLSEVTARTLVPVLQDGQWQTEEGAGVEFTPPEAGMYALEVTARDAAGREVLTKSSFHVAGPGQLAWDFRNPSQVDLVPDKSLYLPGETAEILIKTPLAGEAMISIERGGEILRTMRIRLEGNAPTFKVPLEATDAPNVFVSLLLLRGADESKRKFPMPEYRYGLCLLKVENAASRLQVAIEPASVEVTPGDEVRSRILVRDGLGQPVAGAGVTFFAVDDGILALTGYERPQPGAVFGEAIPLQVRTGLSLFSLMPEDPADLEFSNKGYLIGGGGGGGGGIKVRDNFPGTASWQPNLRTGADGAVAAVFAAPDALTRYRLVAVADAGADAFGSGESAIRISKPLMLLPSLGQFANEGDRLLARVVVRNQTGQDGEVEIGLEVEGAVEIEGKPRQRVAVANGESKAVDFPVTFQAPGETKWTWSASLAAGETTYEDRVLTSLPVGSPMVKLNETYLPDLKPGVTNLLDGINPQLSEGTGQVTVSVATSRLASLRGSADYLLEYPYGCTEQTVSSLVPWMVAPEFGSLWPGMQKPEAETRRVIADTVAKLFALQTGSGGLSFWPGGNQTSLFASAWAAVVFSHLSNQGIELPPGWDKLKTFLSDHLRRLDTTRNSVDLGELALVCYALSSAGQAEPAYHEQLYERRAELSHEARALLALAILKADGSSKVAGELLDAKKPAPEDYSPFGGAARERAIQLLAWTAYKPSSKEVPRLVAELLQYRRVGRWSNTQDNAWALLALAEYRNKVELAESGQTTKSAKPEQPAPGQMLAGELVSAFELTAAAPAARHEFPWKPAPSLEVKNDSKATLYGEAQFAVYPPLGRQPRQDRGYSVSRTYQKMGADGSLGEAVDLKVGDRIVVSLRVESSRPGHFVALDDPLPSIFEAVNPEFQSRAVGGSGVATWPPSHQEMRSDRVVFFCDQLPAGAFVFRYLARVRTAGEATAPATRVEEMYRPERFGLSETQSLQSQPARP